MDATGWDERYAGFTGTRSVGPTPWLDAMAATLTPGRALDLGAGDGRQTIALARRGWDVTAVDFSAIALKRLEEFARVDLTPDSGHIHLVQADLTSYRPDPATYDLVLLAYMHLPHPMLDDVLVTAASALAPDGTLLLVGHDRSGYGRGTGGPDDPAVLWTVDELTDAVQAAAMHVVSAGQVDRDVTVDGQHLTAIDTVLVAQRAPMRSTNAHEGV